MFCIGSCSTLWSNAPIISMIGVLAGEYKDVGVLFYYCFTKAFPCNQVRDIKIKFLGNLKQETEEDRSEWRKLCSCLKVCELKPFSLRIMIDATLN